MTSRPLVLLAACAVALASACSKRASDTTAPPSSSLPPQVTATHPPARSTGVLYDTEIWVQFDRALDPATVSATTVFLKLDSRRIASTVRYEDITRRIVVVPQVVLDLQKTYTVEISPAVKSYDGTPLPRTAFFQFTTNSVRRPVADFPTQDALEGPFGALGWSGNGGPIGGLLYEVYASTDSVAVEQRTIPYLQRAVYLYHLPHLRWPSGSTVYWAVTVENLSTGERLPGAVGRFRTIDAATPVDSVIIGVADWGGHDSGTRTQYCARTTIPSGPPRYSSAVHWPLTSLPSTYRLADVRVEMNVTSDYANQTTYAYSSLWLAQNEWAPCTVTAPGPPYAEVVGNLATGVPTSPQGLRYQSEYLSAFFEAQIRRRPYVYGTVIRSSIPLFYAVTDASGVPPRAVLYFYR